MIGNLVDYINIFFMYYIFIYAVIFFISTIYSTINLNEYLLRKKFSNNLSIKSNVNYIPVSVLIPAFNEELTILACIDSILNTDYPECEIIIINDGSTDLTENVIIEEYGLKKVMRPIRRLVKSKSEVSIYEGFGKPNIKITLVNKKNGGKADALNLGVNVARYPFFISLDADSILQKDSISNIIVPFMEDERTIAVGGNIRVSNQVEIKNGEVVKLLEPKKWLVLFQIIEYYRVFLTTRIFLNRFNGNLIISGAFGLFKKAAVVNVGGYDNKSIGEDMSLIVKLHSYYRQNKIPYNMQYSPTALCWSQVPEKLSDLKSQRIRWHIGLMQSLLEHKYIFLNVRYGLVGTFSFLYYFIYEMISCVLEVVGFTFIVVAYFTGLINLQFFLIFILVYLGYSVVVSMASIVLGNYLFRNRIGLKYILKLLGLSLLECFGYRQMCSFYRLMAIFSYSQYKNKWGKIERRKHETC